MFCAIRYHLGTILKNTKNTNGGVILLLKLQALVSNFTKNNTPPLVFFTFVKLYKASHVDVILDVWETP